jgi:hypothetical protein
MPDLEELKSSPKTQSQSTPSFEIKECHKYHFGKVEDVLDVTKIIPRLPELEEI